MITRIEAKNYRCLKGVAHDLGSFHVVAGPNGSGKSTFFEVPRVLGAFAKGGLDNLLQESACQRLEELFFKGKGDALELAVEMSVPTRVLPQTKQPMKQQPVLRYEVRIGHSPAAGLDKVSILAEKLYLVEKSAPRPRADVVQSEFDFPSVVKPDFSVVHDTPPRNAGWKVIANKTETGNSYFKAETTNWNLSIRNASSTSALSALPADDRFPLSNWFKAELLESQQHLSLRSELMRLACPPLKSASFLSDGSNLPNVVEQLRRNKTNYRSWIEHLQTSLPIRDIKVVTNKDTMSKYLLVAYHSGEEVPSWHLSDGTLRMLALTMIGYLGGEGKVLFIEEPENGIHPQAMETVFQSLSSLYDGQVLVATHSPIFVGLIEPRQLLCFSKSPEGATDIVTGDTHPRLKEWRDGTSLARFYAAGVLS